MGTVLVVDFNNAVHRARSGFTRGENSITYTFFLMFRKMVETFSPDSIYIVKEGRPQARHDLLDTYKANRGSAGDDFCRQHGNILKILSMMPVNIVRHPLRECDDTIAHIVRKIRIHDECVIVSTDTDFIQLLSGDPRIRLWNPVKDAWIDPHPVDYVMWKSLTGDGTDNVSGFQGVGSKTATKLVSNPAKLKEFLSVEGRQALFDRNMQLIAFQEINDALEVTDSFTDWPGVYNEFTRLDFQSLIKEKTWKKYVDTFDCVEYSK